MIMIMIMMKKMNDRKEEEEMEKKKSLSTKTVKIPESVISNVTGVLYLFLYVVKLVDDFHFCASIQKM